MLTSHGYIWLRDMVSQLQLVGMNGPFVSPTSMAPSVITHLHYNAWLV